MSKILMVEGATEKRLIPELMEQRGVNWEPFSGQYAVKINDCEGFASLVAPREIEATLKTSGLESLGIVFDADDLHDGESNRWKSIRARFEDIGFNPPNNIPKDGLIITQAGGPSIGAWMMPDNSNRGMLETFLQNLIPNDTGDNPLYDLAKQSVSKAKQLDAPFKDAHEDKAIIHSWLAWQNQPGAQLHDAIKFKLFDSQRDEATPFVNWFRKLFEV